MVEIIYFPKLCPTCKVPVYYAYNGAKPVCRSLGCDLDDTEPRIRVREMPAVM